MAGKLLAKSACCTRASSPLLVNQERTCMQKKKKIINKLTENTTGVRCCRKTVYTSAPPLVDSRAELMNARYELTRFFLPRRTPSVVFKKKKKKNMRPQIVHGFILVTFTLNLNKVYRLNNSVLFILVIFM